RGEEALVEALHLRRRGPRRGQAREPGADARPHAALLRGAPDGQEERRLIGLTQGVDWNSHSNMPPRAATPSRPSRVEQKRASLQDGVLRAALELFAGRPYHTPTTPDIMARAGIRAGTLSRHFPTKDALIT